MTTEEKLAALPPLLRFADGRPVADADDWPARRTELLDILQAVQYGYLPPAPEAVTAELLHPFCVSPHFDAAGAHYRLTLQPWGFSFLVLLVTPPGEGPFPLIIDGDACWRSTLTDEILALVTKRGYALALFNRVELAPDNYTSARESGIYPLFPALEFGALAAWAWGYTRVVDFALTLPQIDAAHLVATGASRGGKTCLLAGAIDERIALTAPNDSGCGGAGCYRFPDAGGERLRDLMRAIPYWFAPGLAAYSDREEALPFDQHFLKAAVAPRALLTTEARGDAWASPHGTRLTHEAAREAYRLLDVESRIGLWIRDGSHAHEPADWTALLEFADLQFFDKPTSYGFDMRP